MRTEILGVSFDNVTMQEALSIARQQLESGRAGYVVTPNAEMLLAARSDEAFREILNGAALTIPDGVGVIYSGKILGTPLKEKVAGVELSWKFLKVLEESGKRLFLLGAKPGVAQAAADKMQQAYPRLVIAGVQDGYFKEDSTAVEAIRNAQADVVYVCLGFPKQERFMAQHLNASGAGLMFGLGGSLDVFAGNVSRAPKFFVKCGLEWLYRLIKEPWRYKRMLRLPLVLWIALKERLFGKHQKK